MRVTLEVIEGHRKDRGKRLEITRTEPDNITAGRSARKFGKFKEGHAQIQVSHYDLRVSRWHFMLMIRPPNCYIRDIGSTNHTFVNNFKKKKYLKDVIELKNGDVIKAGETHLKVHIVDKNREEPQEEKIIKLSEPVYPKEKHVWVPEEEPEKKKKTKKQEAKEKPIEEQLVMQCSHCGRDLSEQVNSDGKAKTLKDTAIYLCKECVQAEREEYKKIADYILLKQIGTGGMGVVYKAVHKPTGRIAALKEIIPSKPMDEKRLELFCREISISRDIIHPAIVRFYDSFTRKRKPFLVTEYLPGGSAEEKLLNKQKPFAIEEAFRIIIEILGGLSYIHEKRIVHRDIKPQNILFDKNGRAKLSDLGLAKSYELAGQSGITGAEETSGTILYMAPEQILDFCFVKPPADVYSMGVCFYYFLTGKFPYHFPSSLDMLMGLFDLKKVKHLFTIILEDDPIPIEEQKKDIPKRLAAVIDRCLKKNPLERFKDGEELMEALLRVQRTSSS